MDVVTEHVDVEAADGVADALFVHPAEGVHPAVLVYMDAYGIRPSLEALAERLASLATPCSCRTSSTGTAARRWPRISTS